MGGCMGSVPTGLITEAHIVTTDLGNGLDSRKGDEFLLVINSIVNEKSAVDVAALALGPLLTVKGLNTHSNFHTARGMQGGGQGGPGPGQPPSHQTSEGQGLCSFSLCQQICAAAKNLLGGYCRSVGFHCPSQVVLYVNTHSLT